MSENDLISIIMVLIVIVATLMFTSNSLFNKNRYLKRRVSYFESTYLSRHGDAMDWGNYYLVSLDGGKTWYAANREDGKVTMVGPAEETFPGLIAHLEGMDALLAHTAKHGPITVGSSLTLKEQEVLETAGITVEAKS